MGNHKFKLSDMMPNAWFYKLKDMSKSTRKKTSLSKNNTNSNSAPTTISPSKYSHYLVPDPETPRFGDPLYSSPFNYPKVSDAYSCTSPAWKSASCTRKTIYKRNDACFTYRSNDGNSDPFYYSVSSSECSPRRPSFELFNADIVIDVDGDHHCCHGQHQESCFGAGKRNASFDKEEMVNDLDDFRPLNMVSEPIELPPILTKFPIQDDPTATAAFERSKSFRYAEEEEAVLTSMTRESRDQDSLVTKKQKKKKKKKKLQVQGGNERCKRSEWENFAVVKASFDPQRDFKESMREMILENDIRASKDLEELLACYLTLNSDRYHPMIIEAFEDIWIEMFGSSHTGFSSTK